MGIEKVIGVDAQGGTPLEEKGKPTEEVYHRATLATKKVAEKHPEYVFYLVGNPEDIKRVLGEEHPNIVVEPGRGSKFRAITRLGELIEAQKIGGFYTCGDTREVLPVVMSKIGMMDECAEVFPGELLAPLLAEIPKSPFLERARSAFALDVGSIPELKKPEQYVLYAKLGEIYATVMGRPNPAIGLINIGAEQGKGKTMLKEAYNLLKKSGLNFAGNVEPFVCVNDRDKGDYTPRPIDVYLSEGETGNLLIKALAAGADLASNFIRYEIEHGNLFEKGAGLFLKNRAFARAKKRADPSATGGAVFMGTNKPVYKNHGTFTTYGMTVGLERYIAFVENKVQDKVRGTFKAYAD